VSWEVQEYLSSNMPLGWVWGMPSFGTDLPLSPWLADHLGQGMGGKGWLLLWGLVRGTLWVPTLKQRWFPSLCSHSKLLELTVRFVH